MYKISESSQEDRASKIEERLNPGFLRGSEFLVKGFKMLSGDNPKIESIVFYRQVLENVLREVYEDPEDRHVFKAFLIKAIKGQI